MIRRIVGINLGKGVNDQMVMLIREDTQISEKNKQSLQIFDFVDIWEGMIYHGAVKCAVFRGDKLIRVNFFDVDKLRAEGVKLIRGKARTKFLRSKGYTLDKVSRMPKPLANRHTPIMDHKRLNLKG